MKLPTPARLLSPLIHNGMDLLCCSVEVFPVGPAVNSASLFAFYPSMRIYHTCSSPVSSRGGKTCKGVVAENLACGSRTNEDSGQIEPSND